MKWFIFYLQLLAFVGCRVSSNSAQQQNQMDHSTQIILINLNFTYDSTSNSTIAVLKDTSLIHGRIKNNGKTYLSRYNLRCELLDKEKTILTSLNIENPLFRTFEAPSPDGLITPTVIRQKSADVNLRVNYFKSAKFIRIFESNEGKAEKEIACIAFK